MQKLSKITPDVPVLLKRCGRFKKGKGKNFFLIKRFFSERKDGFSLPLKPHPFFKKKSIIKYNFCLVRSFTEAFLLLRRDKCAALTKADQFFSESNKSISSKAFCKSSL